MKNVYTRIQQLNADYDIMTHYGFSTNIRRILFIIIIVDEYNSVHCVRLERHICMNFRASQPVVDWWDGRKHTINISIIPSGAQLKTHPLTIKTNKL